MFECVGFDALDWKILVGSKNEKRFSLLKPGKVSVIRQGKQVSETEK